MNLSLNEVESGIRKAALGAGLPLGLAEDTGRAVAFLHGAGFDGISAALACFSEGFTPAVAFRENGQARFEMGHPIGRAVAALDLVAAGQVQQAELIAFSQPLLVAGLAMVASVDQDAGLSLTFAKGAKAQILAQGIAIEGVIPNEPGTIVVARTNAPTRIPVRQAHIQNVSAGLWDQIQRLAACTYVPSSAQSRLSGAGAGVTDND